jgi:hypothetical protein
MIWKQKYVVTANKEMIVFSELLQHKEFKELNPTSAGFISIFVKDGQTDCLCYGDSVSLGVKSDEVKDTYMAKRQILGHSPYLSNERQ